MPSTKAWHRPDSKKTVGPCPAEGIQSLPVKQLTHAYASILLTHRVAENLLGAPVFPPHFTWGCSCPVIGSIVSHQGWQSGYRRGTCLWYPFMLSYAENKWTWPDIISQKSLAVCEWFQLVRSRLSWTCRVNPIYPVYPSRSDLFWLPCICRANWYYPAIYRTSCKWSWLRIVGFCLLHLHFQRWERVRSQTNSNIVSIPCRAWSIRETGACSNRISNGILLHSGWLPLGLEEFRVELVHGASKRWNNGYNGGDTELQVLAARWFEVLDSPKSVFGIYIYECIMQTT